MNKLDTAGLTLNDKLICNVQHLDLDTSGSASCYKRLWTGYKNYITKSDFTTYTFTGSNENFYLPVNSNKGQGLCAYKFNLNAGNNYIWTPDCMATYYIWALATSNSTFNFTLNFIPPCHVKRVWESLLFTSGDFPTWPSDARFHECIVSGDTKIYNASDGRDYLYLLCYEVGAND